MACDQLAVDISDKRKMVSFIRTFTFTRTIQVNESNSNSSNSSGGLT